MKKVVIILMVSFMMLPFSTVVLAEEHLTKEPSTGDRVGDILWIRPLGFIRVVLEAAAYAISLPVTTRRNQEKEASEFLIDDPDDFCFKRPLGEI